MLCCSQSGRAHTKWNYCKPSHTVFPNSPGSVSLCTAVQYLCVCKQADSDTDTVEDSGSACCVCRFCNPCHCESVGSCEAPQRLLVAAGTLQSWAKPACACLSSSSSPRWAAADSKSIYKSKYCFLQATSEYLGQMVDPRLQVPSSSREFHCGVLVVRSWPQQSPCWEIKHVRPGLARRCHCRVIRRARWGVCIHTSVLLLHAFLHRSHYIHHGTTVRSEFMHSHKHTRNTHLAGTSSGVSTTLVASS